MFNKTTFIDGATPVLDAEHLNSMEDSIYIASQICNPNLLINGAFQIWQRGTNFTPSSSNTYTADRWHLATLNPSITVSQTPGSKLSIVNTSVFAKNARFGQFIELPHCLQGKTVTLSMNINCDIAQDVMLFGASYDGSTINTIGSTKITLSPTQNIYSVTFTAPNTSYLYVGLALACSASGYYGSTGAMSLYSCTINVWYAKLEVGYVVTPLSPRLYGEELMSCQRYYETGDSYRGVVGDSFRLSTNIIFKATKRDTPTITLNTYDTSNKIMRSCDNTLFDYIIYHTGWDMCGVIDVVRDNSTVNSGDVFIFNWVADSEIY